jgi:LPS-assembly lipoprotein
MPAHPRHARPADAGPDCRRRAWIAAASALAMAPLVGCGFELRRPPTLNFRTVQLTGFKPNSPFERELRANINASQTTIVVDSAGQAQVILEALSDRREKNVVATTASGQVRDLALRVRFNFRLRTVAGRELIAPTELVLGRDMSYSETAALAKEYEEALLYRELQKDIVTQIMRRLATVPAP